MKSLIAIALLSLSLGAFSAENSCIEKCHKLDNQTALKCKKIQQICQRWPAETTGHDMCIVDFYECIDQKRAELQACYNECELSK